jgi:DNA-binding NtrC family response regulator
MSHNWPGNVRELENIVERELIRYRGRQLQFETLHPSEKRAEPGHLRPAQDYSPRTLDETMALHIAKTLDLAGGRISGPGGAAERLGINPSTLRARMNKLGITYGRRNRR